MAIVFNCQCGQKLSAKDEHAGKQIKCPNCQAVLTVPRQEGMEPAGRMRPSAQEITEETPKAVRRRREFDDDDEPSLRRRADIRVEPLSKAFYLGSIIGSMVLAMVLFGIGYAIMIPQLQQNMQNPQAGGFPAFSPIFLIGYIPLIYGAVVGAMLIYKMWAA